MKKKDWKNTGILIAFLLLVWGTTCFMLLPLSTYPVEHLDTIQAMYNVFVFLGVILLLTEIYLIKKWGDAED